MATRVLYWLVGIAVLVAANRLAAVQSAVSVSPERALLDQYCVSCHNDRLRTGGLSLNGLDLANVGATRRCGKQWCASCARAPCRPPARRGPTSRATSGSCRTSRPSWIAPPPATRSRAHRHVPAAEPHRVSQRGPRSARARRRRQRAAADRRCELRVRQRERRRTVADVDGALSRAAQKVSRLAVGSPVPAPGSRVVVLPPDLTQEEHVDGLPFGTRGGTAVAAHVPARRRVRDPGPPRAQPQRERRRPDRAARDRAHARRRAAGALHGHAEPQPHGRRTTPTKAWTSTWSCAPRVTAGPARGRRDLPAKDTARSSRPSGSPTSRTSTWTGIRALQPAVHSVSIDGPVRRDAASATRRAGERIFVCRPAPAGGRRLRQRQSSRPWRAAPIDGR